MAETAVLGVGRNEIPPYYTELSKSTVQVLLTSAFAEDVTSSVINDTKVFTGDSSIKVGSGAAIKANGGKETNITINEGTLLIEGYDWDGAAYVSGGGKLNFYGGDITLENKYNAYYVDTVRVNGTDSKVSFHNNNTLIKGKTSYGLSLINGAAGYAENLIIALDRSGGTITQEDETLGILIGTNGSFKANGTADISVKGSNTYDKYVEALCIQNGQTVDFNKAASFKAEGGYYQAYGIMANQAQEINFKDKLTVSAKNAEFSNTGIYLNEIDGAAFNGLDVAASGGDSTADGSSATGVIISGVRRTTFGGETRITAKDNASVNNGMLVEWNSNVSMGGTEITASGGKSAAGLLLSFYSNVDFEDTLKVNVSGGSKQNNGINIYKESAMTAGDVIVNAAGGEDATAFAVTDGSSASLSGALGLYVGEGGSQKGLMVTEKGSSFHGKEAEIRVGGDSGVALYVETGGKAVFDGDAAIAAKTGAHVHGDGSAAVFSKGFDTQGRDTLLEAFSKGTLEVNKDSSGTVRFTGKTNIEKTVELENGVIFREPDGVINMNLNGAGSYWRLTGDSSLTNISSNSSLIDMTADGGAFSVLATDNLAGSGGWVKMDIDASKNTNNSDMILVKEKFSGSQYIDLNRVDAGEVTAAAGTVLAKVKDNQGVFLANDNEGTLFYDRYLLDQTESETEGYTVDWYLKEVTHVIPEEKPTTSVATVKALSALNYHTWRSENDKLMQRMGDLRKSAGADRGAWFRVRGSKINMGGDSGFENKYVSYEVGYDGVAKRTDKYTRYAGAAFSYTDGDSSYARGDGENSGKAVSLYLTHLYNSGHYLDMVFKLGNWDNDFTVYDTKGNRIKGDTENTGISFSLEYGRKCAIGKNGWYIEPQAQLTYGYLYGDSFALSNGVAIKQDGIDSLVGRVGFNLGWDISKNSNVYLKANLMHEFCGGYGISMSDGSGRLKLTGDYGDTWFEYGIGCAIQTGKNNHLYFDLESSEGGELDKEWQWNVGMRWDI